MRYQVIDDHGRSHWDSDDISDCQRWIAGQFGVEFRKVDNWDREPRHENSMGAYFKDGLAFEIVRLPVQPSLPSPVRG